MPESQLVNEAVLCRFREFLHKREISDPKISAILAKAGV
jgi:hypothetical protein